MDSCVVHILLCLILAHASCLPHGAREVLDTIQLIQRDIQSALDSLSGTVLPLNISCHSLNSTELSRPELQPLSARHFSSLRCYVLEASRLVPELSELLASIGQHAEDAEQLMSGRVVDQPCSLLASGDHVDDYVHTKCLLQFVNKWYNNTTALTG